MSSEVDFVNAYIEKLNDHVTDQVKRGIIAETQQKLITDQVTVLQKGNEDLRNELATITADHNDVVRTNDGLKASLVSASEYMKELENKSDVLEKDIEILTSSQFDLSDLRDQLTKNLTEATNTIVEQAAHIDSLNNHIESLNSHTSTLQTEISSLREREQYMASDYSDLASALTQAKEKIFYLENPPIPVVEEIVVTPKKKPVKS